MNVQIKDLAKWGEPKKVNTVNGSKILRKADITPEFSKLYKTNKDELKRAGVSLMKENDSWVICWWQDDVVDAKAVEMSKATKGSSKNLLCPAGLEYLPYQKACIEYALDKSNILIADEMGLGKTIETIGIINNKPGVKSILIVAPKTLLLNWKNELTKWLVDQTLTISIAHSKYTDANIVVTNYESLNKFKKEFNKKWDIVVLDEAHYIKNKDRQRSKNAKSLKSTMKIRLTGTPILNRPVELFNIVEDLDNKNFGDFWKFARRYCAAHRGDFGWDFKGASHLDELQLRLRQTIMVRRLKSEVLKELPKKIRQAVEIEVTREQAKLIAREAELKIQYDKLFQAADFAELSLIKHQLGLSKVPAVVDFVKDGLDADEDKKVIIATHHKDVAEIIAESLKEYGVVVVTGDIKNMDDRQACVDKFQNDPQTRVFVGTIKAAGVGLTLTASSWVVFAELDETPGVMNQMEDRAHRIGQTDTVLVQHLVLEGSYDSKNIDSLFKKQQVIDQALDNNVEAITQAPVEKVDLKAAKSAQKTSVELKQPTNQSSITLSEKKIVALHDALKLLAGEDVDGAMELNGVGFNKMDSRFGNSLATQSRLSEKQAESAYKMVKKYHRQLPQELFEAIYG